MNPAIRKIDYDQMVESYQRTQRNIAFEIGKAQDEMKEAMIYAREMQRRYQDTLEEDGYTSELQYWTERVQNLKLAQRVLNEARLFSDYNR